MAKAIDADALSGKIREYMADYPNATARLTACRAVLSMLGDEKQTPTVRADHIPKATKITPLTLDELREMDGEAVYLMPMKWWALVDSPKGLKRVILRLKGGGWAAFYSEEDLKNYVEAVYRRPPEGEGS